VALRFSIRKWVRRLALTGIALAALSAQNGSSAPDRMPVRIEVPSTNNLQFLTLWVALGAKYFQQEGLEPRIVAASTPRNTGDLLLRGEADVALLPPPMFLGMMAEQKPIVLFASLLANEPINLIVRQDIGEARKIRANASLRERLRTIAGLKVGLASEVAPRLRILFASAGMNADKDLQLVVVAGPDQLRAFADGRVDALFAHTPYLETALVQHHAILIADNSAGEVEALAKGQIHALATTRAQARANPALIAAVARAIARAQILIHSDSKTTVDAIIASGAAAQANRQQLEAIVAIYGPAVPRTPQISLSGIARDATLYPAHPRAPDFRRTKVADYVAAEFAKPN
jgi:ABC-type nitrate/sulfonate/bicarbonate transport system substrate-binding protein